MGAARSRRVRGCCLRQDEVDETHDPAPMALLGMELNAYGRLVNDGRHELGPIRGCRQNLGLVALDVVRVREITVQRVQRRSGEETILAPRDLRPADVGQWQPGGDQASEVDRPPRDQPEPRGPGLLAPLCEQLHPKADTKNRCASCPDSLDDGSSKTCSLEPLHRRTEVADPREDQVPGRRDGCWIRHDTHVESRDRQLVFERPEVPETEVDDRDTSRHATNPLDRFCIPGRAHGRSSRLTVRCRG